MHTAILGDTFYAASTPPAEIQPVNQSIETRQSMVFAGLYPIDSNAFDRLADAIQRVLPPSLPPTATYIHAMK
jgi:translation elongation factor EF-4